MQNRKSIHFPTSAVLIIIACFALGVADMVMLEKAMRNVFNMDAGIGSYALAFIIATVANFTALMWGKENGEKLQKRSINKYSLLPFALWAVIGVAYALIRVMFIVQVQASPEEYEETFSAAMLISECVQAAVLAILYIGTGTTIAQNAAVIFDYDCERYRNAKKNYETLRARIGNEQRILMNQIRTLETFENNSAQGLRGQYEGMKDKIKQEQIALVSYIAAKTAEKNPHVDSNSIDIILDEAIGKI